MSAVKHARLALALGAATSSLVLALALSACESATNLDVVYAADASSPTETSTADAPAAAVEAASLAAFSACPCDESAGLGCCIPAVGAPFCTADSTVCAGAKGVHVKCSHPDPLTESACCWRAETPGAAGTFTVAALAATCGSGASACTVDTDCAGTGQTKCSLTTCAGAVTIGMCGLTPPACPAP